MTILIPSHNRQSYFQRLNDYYGGKDLNIIIVDSTSNIYEGRFNENIKYVHLAGSRFAQKVLTGASLVDDDIIGLCADDDIFIEQGLTACSKALREHGAGLCRGTAGKFYHDEFGTCFFAEPTENFRVYEKGNKSTRFLAEYKQILWSVYRKEALTEVFMLIQNIAPKNDNYIELIIAMYTQYKYGIVFTSDLYHLREVSPTLSWGHSVIPVPFEKADAALKERSRIIQALSEHIPYTLANSDINLYVQKHGAGFFGKLKFDIYKLLSSQRIIEWHKKREIKGLRKCSWS
jgi:glycosyltransferase domain-containing protein